MCQYRRAPGSPREHLAWGGRCGRVSSNSNARSKTRMIGERGRRVKRRRTERSAGLECAGSTALLFRAECGASSMESGVKGTPLDHPSRDARLGTPRCSRGDPAAAALHNEKREVPESHSAPTIETSSVIYKTQTEVCCPQY